MIAMIKRDFKWRKISRSSTPLFASLIAIGLLAQLAFPGAANLAPGESAQIKELNFVFLHGAGGNTCTFQLLEDSIRKRLPAYATLYERNNPNTKIEINTLKRCYPGYVDIETWASNIVKSINQHFPDKKNLILIGHSMGGKSALYTVAQNIGDLADRVAMVVTINSPVKSLNKYHIAGGGPVFNYCRAVWYESDQGICNSVTHYDSSEDGERVGTEKHWLAFISAEATPLSEQFNVGGVDAWPRNMDDSIIPLSAQYAEGADVIYYGEYGHSEFSTLDTVAGFMAEQILRYVFGEPVECSVLTRGGIISHEAGWLPGRDSWEDIVGGIPASSGSVWHVNESYTKWQEWEDVVGYCPRGEKRANYYITRLGSLPFLATIEESRWFSPDDSEDCRLYLRTRAAPRSRVQVNWSVHSRGLLPPESIRDHYEVKIVTGTPLTKITGVSWLSGESCDLRLQIWSEADRPFRWFKAEWKVYSKEKRQRNIIDEIPAQVSLRNI